MKLKDEQRKEWKFVDDNSLHFLKHGTLRGILKETDSMPEFEAGDWIAIGDYLYILSEYSSGFIVSNTHRIKEIRKANGVTWKE